MCLLETDRQRGRTENSELDYSRIEILGERERERAWLLSRIVLNIVAVNVILILILMSATVAVSHLPSLYSQTKARYMQ